MPLSFFLFFLFLSRTLPCFVHEYSTASWYGARRRFSSISERFSVLSCPGRFPEENSETVDDNTCRRNHVLVRSRHCVHCGRRRSSSTFTNHGETESQAGSQERYVPLYDRTRLWRSRANDASAARARTPCMFRAGTLKSAFRLLIYNRW